MLIDLSIKNLAIVDNLQLEFNAGMTVITGETGAGKSIIIDALGLIIGERATSSIIRNNCTKAELSACFDINALPKARQFLLDNDLLATEHKNTCILRRIINKSSHSRCYINDNIVTVNQLKILGELLVNIHGQHQHQSLLKEDLQLELLDTYSNHKELLLRVQTKFELWQTSKKSYANLLKLEQELDRLELLKYQLTELDELNLDNTELEKLEQQHDKLANAKDLLLYGNTTLQDLKLAENNIYDRSYSCYQNINDLNAQYPELKNCLENLQQALINIEESSQDLEKFLSSLDLEPEQLDAISKRLSEIYNLARKHKINPKDLIQHRENLRSKLTKYQQLEENLLKAKQDIDLQYSQYKQVADELTISRKKHAEVLAKKIKIQLQKLAMPHVIFTIDFKQDNTTFSKTGCDKIEFMVTTNPGQPLQAIRKVASGGELSRISLAIEVITSNNKTTPTLIFDEVDVGISGETATIVGQLLKSISNKSQTICITHLPQVATQGMHHLKVVKHQTANSTNSSIIYLDLESRTKEIARLLAGASITSEALAHAKHMLINT
jgi:DNA repair protein RecN (Recombination protein N)